eukprot:m.1037421 g.1037421  ORF g.1037421 m.1037421 type:complete len:369 (-) comp24143_c0_seq10:104-1210(-)
MPSKRWFSLDTSNGYISLRGDSDTDDELVPCPLAVESDEQSKTSPSTVRSIECDDDDVERERRELSVLDTPPLSLAQQITLLDFEAFEQIGPEELRGEAWTKKNKCELAPHVIGFTRRFNDVSYWVITEILRHDELSQRARCLSHFIYTAKCLRELNNVNGLLAIMSGLGSASIHRLRDTWEQLDTKTQKQFVHLSTFTAEEGNFKNLREHMKSAKAPYIPHICITLTDLVHLDVVAEGPEGKERRVAEMNEQIASVLKFTTSVFPFAVDTELRKYFLAIKFPAERRREVDEDATMRIQRLHPSHAMPKHPLMEFSFDRNETTVLIVLVLKTAYFLVHECDFRARFAAGRPGWWCCYLTGNIMSGVHA